MILIVTSQQLADGYVVRVCDTMIRLRYHVLRERDDGTFAVDHSHSFITASP